jgi:hypothetical protein
MTDDSSSDRTDSGALSIALNGAGREAANAFLEKQGRLIDLQIEDLRREDALRHWSLRIRHISDMLKLGFEFSAAAIVIAVALFIGSAVWSAANDHGLTIEAFDVPEDLAARGITGKMLPGQLLDRLFAHLEWGKALWWSGKRGEASKQFVLAPGLDLSSSDRADLSKWMKRDG